MSVKVNELVVRYGDKTAVDHMSFEVREGQIFGLLGPNGAGKSTTISALLGLKKIDGGTITAFGLDFSRNQREIKRRIGYVPQEISLYTELSALDNLRFFGKLYGLRGKALEKNVDEAFEIIGLTDSKKAAASTFSGGMKRRLNIGCALVHKPKLVIMDEPTVGIDPQSRNHILESIERLNHQGTTVIYTTHYMEEAEKLCDFIAVVDMGRVIASGTKEELKASVSNDIRVGIELEKADPALPEKLRLLPGLKSCALEENTLRLIVSCEKYRLSGIIDIITESGGNILSADAQLPTLETVFLTLTGKKLRD